jgi:hypothetical protein
MGYRPPNSPARLWNTTNAAPVANNACRLNANTSMLNACRLNMPRRPLTSFDAVTSQTPRRSSTAIASCNTVHSLT